MRWRKEPKRTKLRLSHGEEQGRRSDELILKHKPSPLTRTSKGYAEEKWRGPLRLNQLALLLSLLAYASL